MSHFFDSSTSRLGEEIQNRHGTIHDMCIGVFGVVIPTACTLGIFWSLRMANCHNNPGLGATEHSGRMTIGVSLSMTVRRRPEVGNGIKRSVALDSATIEHLDDQGMTSVFLHR